MTGDKRFKVALSFPGEKREYIQEVAEHLAFALGKENVFYDDYYIDELAIPDLDIYLGNIYKRDSDLIAYFLCKDYIEKKWCNVEWRIIREALFNHKGADLMQFRFDDSEVEGVLAIDGYIDASKRNARETSELILKRVRKKEAALVRKLIVDTEGAIETLKQKEKEIEELKTTQQISPSPELRLQIQTLTGEKETLRYQLLQQDSIIAQQESTRKELEQSLAAVQGKEELKVKALEAVEEKNYDVAEELIKEAAAERMQKVAEDFYQLGNIKELKLEYTEALNYYELAAKIPSYNTLYLHKAGQFCQTFGLFNRALYYHEKSLSINLNKWGEESESVAIDYNELGIIWTNKGNLDTAIEYYEKALAIDLKLFGKENLNASIRYNNLGNAWRNKGNLNKAIDYCEKGLAIDLKLSGEESLNVAARYATLGDVWQGKGDLDKALGYHEKSLAINIKLLKKEHPKVAICFNNLGFIWKTKGDLDKAIDFYEKALAIDINVLGQESRNVSTYYNNIGGAWRSKGDLYKASDYIQKALEIDLKLNGEETPNAATHYNNLGSIYFEKGDINQAIELAEKAYGVFLKLYGADNPSTKTAKENLDGYLSLQKQ